MILSMISWFVRDKRKLIMKLHHNFLWCLICFRLQIFMRNICLMIQCIRKKSMFVCFFSRRFLFCSFFRVTLFLFRIWNSNISQYEKHVRMETVFIGPSSMLILNRYLAIVMNWIDFLKFALQHAKEYHRWVFQISLLTNSMNM